ncbi:hypothetical protein [Ekhidna sp.]|uniref:hypothetical protein n=1 Tax=Ekhidna sp. TaxID=2608089 RepID=UPI003298344A
MIQKTITDFKGQEYFDHFFDSYAEKFRLSPDLDTKTKDILIWLAWKENNFPAFKFFMTEFSNNLSEEKYATSLWQNRIGHFYLKYGDIENAINHFLIGVKEFQNVEYLGLLYAGLSMAYYRSNNRKLAEKYVSKANLVARNQDNIELNSYIIRLENLMGKSSAYGSNLAVPNLATE